MCRVVGLLTIDMPRASEWVTIDGHMRVCIVQLHTCRSGLFGPQSATSVAPSLRNVAASMSMGMAWDVCGASCCTSWLVTTNVPLRLPRSWQVSSHAPLSSLCSIPKKG